MSNSESYQNSSFQNYSSSSPASCGPSRKRKRNISAVLQDQTNVPLQTRRSKARAKTAIQEMMPKKYAPRGNPSAGVAAKQSSATSSAEAVETPVQMDEAEIKTLRSVFNNNRSAFDTGAGMLISYLQRNASYEVQKAVAISIMATAMAKWDHSITSAAQIAAECTQFSQVTVRRWAMSFFVELQEMFQSPDNVTDELIEDQLSSERGHGHTSPSSLIHDEDFRLAARAYVRENAYIKGEPNLTVAKFATWIETTYNAKLHTETARRWLYDLGFTRVHHQKGVYFDGHDRSDVVEYRTNFLATMAELDKKSITYEGNVPELEDELPLIRVVHDESTFHANSDQTYFWGDDETNVLRQKSLGAAIMVSDFVDEVNGFVRDENEEARLQLEIQKDGYFNNEHLLEQVDKTIDIFERIHPDARGIFLFDNAPSHKKLADDALNVERMNVHPGGMQPVMRDTMWNGEKQTLVFDDGTPKGMKAILRERGVDTRGMRAAEMRATLKGHEDFQQAKTLLEDLIEGRGHLCIFYPKYHCELSPIELVWCHAKKHTRAYANGSIVRLRQLVPEGLDNVSTELIQKFFRLCRDYENAYREGHTGKAVEARIKVYKSHRRVQCVD